MTKSFKSVDTGLELEINKRLTCLLAQHDQYQQYRPFTNPTASPGHFACRFQNGGIAHKPMEDEHQRDHNEYFDNVGCV